MKEFLIIVVIIGIVVLLASQYSFQQSRIETFCKEHGYLQPQVQSSNFNSGPFWYTRGKGDAVYQVRCSNGMLWFHFSVIGMRVRKEVGSGYVNLDE